MTEATLLISSKNYSSWSLRGFLLAKISGITFKEERVSPDDPRAKEELLMRTSSILVPCLLHGDISIWDTIAIAEYLNEKFPEVGMLPRDPHARARCRSISGEMHSGFAALRSSLPMNLRFRKPGFTVWSSAQADIDRITSIWRDCLSTWKGPFLFGRMPTIADCMYAPVVTRFQSYDVNVGPLCQEYCNTILSWSPMKEWISEAKEEPQEIIELDLDF
ncbi:glutathione S-transferase [Acidocella aminolytica]|jgi:glutathione S-transferase|uniref:Glutathione S-transferase n=1 Tax=Acidocella aminolytica 101 = DSM 11237 TaxID=1120923 RepID=A0A0D6PC29_9PROT|nr:glutathione S-transferase [Acidocella aminolytica]GAN79315.1 glutathione S-transferase [Acidocella aminolytica 101 = DSM 11237]GBQ39553.1 glutathione S-transferase [Acidocella aminolytica 101 = DSM 11237]SHE38193.1 glutathione S-transferase [Acidocella aminolytica 101 = DSM 11237]